MQVPDETAVAEILNEQQRCCSLGTPEAIVSLLAEQSPVYAGRGTGEAERLRGLLLARLETTGLPATALPFVLEELESGHNPHLVAAAAKALRGAREFPGQTVALLLRAIDRLQGGDDVVRFEVSPQGSAEGRPVTALMELFRTLAWLGPRAGAAEAPLKAMMTERRSGFSVAVMAEIEKALAAISQGSKPAPSAYCAASTVSGVAKAGRRSAGCAARYVRHRTAGPGRRGVFVRRFLCRPAQRADVFLLPLHEPEQVLASPSPNSLVCRR